LAGFKKEINFSGFSQGKAGTRKYNLHYLSTLHTEILLLFFLKLWEVPIARWKQSISAPAPVDPAKPAGSDYADDGGDADGVDPGDDAGGDAGGHAGGDAGGHAGGETGGSEGTLQMKGWWEFNIKFGPHLCIPRN
jgi:hypothetical protein